MLPRLVALLALVASAALPVSLFDVTAHGAKGDGKTLDSAAIQKAIDACHRAGGGVVYFPRGDFLSGTFVLKSNVTLHLSPGATLWGSRHIEDYGPLHLIYARGAENIAIEGSGTINGNGDAFWYPGFKPREKRPSPLIELVECKDVRIENVRIRNTPGWGIHPLLCERVFIRGISMISPYDGPNTDGIDPDSSRDVIISDSYIETGDDCIVLKTTGRLGLPAPPCENVTITNCVLLSDDAALKLGTESHGDFRHIVFSNCAIRKSNVGLAIYAEDGGTFENVGFSNITIETAPTRGRATYPIYIDLERRYEDSRQSRVRDIHFSNITIHSMGRLLVGGMPDHPLENLTFRNIFFRVTGYEAVEKLRKPRGSNRVRPAPQELDYASAPAAMVFANVRGLTLDAVRVHWDAAGTPPERHAIYSARVEDLTVRGFQGRGAATKGKLAAIGLDQSRNVFITGSRAEEGAGVFVGWNGVAKEEILLSGNDLKGAVQETAEGAAYVHLP
jgi:hypothetical protein